MRSTVNNETIGTRFTNESSEGGVLMSFWSTLAYLFGIGR